GAPAGWFDDPSRRHRVRYWDGGRWTAWVADDQQAFQEPSAAYGEQWFWAHVMFVAAPIFFSIWGLFAAFALTHGGTQAGTFLGIVWLVLALGTLRQPYVAIVRPDGSLTFRALTRTITTTVDAIYRVSIAGGRGRNYV